MEDKKYSKDGLAQGTCDLSEQNLAMNEGVMSRKALWSPVRTPSLGWCVFREQRSLLMLSCYCPLALTASDVQAKATVFVIGPCAFLPDTRQPHAPPLLAGSPSHPGHLASITCHSFGGPCSYPLSSGLGTLEAFLEDYLSLAQLSLSFIANIRGGWLSKLLARFRRTPEMGSWERR